MNKFLRIYRELDSSITLASNGIIVAGVTNNAFTQWYPSGTYDDVTGDFITAGGMPGEYWVRMKFHSSHPSGWDVAPTNSGVYRNFEIFFESLDPAAPSFDSTYYGIFDTPNAQNPSSSFYSEELGFISDTPSARVSRRYNVMDKPVTVDPILPNFFDRLNELVFHVYSTSGGKQLDVYYGEADGAGALPLVWSLVGTGSIYPVNYMYLYWWSYVSYPEQLTQTFLDWYAFDIGTGSLPSLIRPIPNSIPESVYTIDLNQFEDTETFIDDLKLNNDPAGLNNLDNNPAGWPNQKNQLFYIFDGYYYYSRPFFDETCFTYHGYDLGPYVLISDVTGAYYYDPSFLLYTNSPSDPVGENLKYPGYILMPTSSAIPGLMMGPLDVGGSIGPTPTPPTGTATTYTTSPIYLKYALTRAPSPRKGLFLQAHSGSPQISLEPVWPTSSWHLPGDIWVANNGINGQRLFYANYLSGSTDTASIVPYHILTSPTPDTFDGGYY